MKSAEVKYAALNELAEQGGIVILGGEEDMNLPLCMFYCTYQNELI